MSYVQLCPPALTALSRTTLGTWRADTALDGPSVGGRKLPGIRLLHAVLPCLVLLGVLLTACECLVRPVGLFDEPLHYLSALLVERGAHANLDFESVYPLFNYQPTAWIFALLGETALAARLLQVVLYVTFLMALGCSFRARGARGARLWCLLLCAVCVTAALPMHTSLLGAALGNLALMSYLYAVERRGAARTVFATLAGALVGLTLVTRVNFALYAGAAIAADQLIQIYAQRRRGEFSARRWLAEEAAPLAVPVLSWAALAAFWYGPHLSQVLHQVIQVPATALADYAFKTDAWEPSVSCWIRHVGKGVLLPVLPAFWLALRNPDPRARLGWFGLGLAVLVAEFMLGPHHPSSLPLLVAPVALGLIISQVDQRSLGRYEFSSLFACCMFAHYYLSRPDSSHLWVSIAPTVLLLPVALPGRSDAKPGEPGSSAHGQPGWVRWGLFALLGLVARPAIAHLHPTRHSLSLALGLIQDSLHQENDAARFDGASALPTALAGLYPDQDENSVVEFLRARTRPDEPVYVGLLDHTRPYINDLRLSWALGRPVGARHFMLMSGITNTREAEQSIVGDLQARQVHWVVLWHAPPGPLDRHLARPLGTGPTLLDDFLHAHYQPVASFGDFTVCESVG